MRRIGWLLTGIVVGVAASYAYVAIAVNMLVARGSTNVAARRAAVERAAEAVMPGARRWGEIPDEERYPGKTIIRVGDSETLPRMLPEEIAGQRSQSSAFVFDDFVLLRLHDWTNVAMEPNGEGVIKALLAQADLHEQALASAGFALLVASGWGEDDWLKPERVRGESVNVAQWRRSQWGAGHAGGTAGYSIDTASPRIVYWRLYADSNSAAVLMVRMEFDQESRRLLTEFCYTDRSFLGVKYPLGVWSVQEQIK